MTNLAPHLTAFLQVYLPNERRFSRHTVQSYTDCFRLLVLYAAEQTKTRPCALAVEHLTVTLLVAFLESLEKDRGNSVSTRNNRLAAIKAFFRRNLSTTLRHRRFLFTDSFLLLWKWRVG